MERGITVRRGRRHIEGALPRILEDADNKLSAALRALLFQLCSEMKHLQSQNDQAGLDTPDRQMIINSLP
jgi:hypothetical protein